MKELFELFRRLVVAIEGIAAVMMNPERTVNADPVGLEATTTGVVGSERTYPADDDRGAWLLMCAGRGIEVPPRTKTPTLIKNVKAWDAAHPESGEGKGPDTLPVDENKTAGEVVADKVDTPPAADALTDTLVDEVDPLNTPDAEVPMTHDEMQTAAMEHRAAYLVKHPDKVAAVAAAIMSVIKTFGAAKLTEIKDTDRAVCLAKIKAIMPL